MNNKPVADSGVVGMEMYRNIDEMVVLMAQNIYQEFGLVNEQVGSVS